MDARCSRPLLLGAASLLGGCLGANPFYVPPPQGGSEAGSASGDPGSTSAAASTAASASGGSSSEGSTSIAETTAMGGCTPGEITCEGGSALLCEPNGVDVTATPCDGACEPELGCVGCTPGSFTCDGQVSLRCDAMGNWSFDQDCDPEMDLSCDVPSGRCVGACAYDSLAKLARADLGCDFYASVTASEKLAKAPFGVIVETGVEAAEVSVTLNGQAVTTTTVAASQGQPVILPSIPNLEEFLDTGLTDYAYRIQSDRPIRVSQFTGIKSLNAASGTALLPVSAWGEAVYAASWGPDAMNKLVRPSMMTITPSHPMTKITLQLPAGVSIYPGSGFAVDGGGEIDVPGGSAVVVVGANGSDLTGVKAIGTGPLQVIGNNPCASVNLTMSCDHVTEAALPLKFLGKKYAAVPPPHLQGGIPVARPQRLRIVATSDGTTVWNDTKEIDFTLDAGEYKDHSTEWGAVVMADKPIAVYSLPEGLPEGMESMVALPPIERWPSETSVFVPLEVVGEAVLIITFDPLGDPLVDGAPLDAVWEILDVSETVAFAYVLIGAAGRYVISDSKGKKISASMITLGATSSAWASSGLGQ